MYNSHLKMSCSNKHSLSNDLEDHLLSSIGPNRTYIAVFEMQTIDGDTKKLLPVFLRFSPYKKQLTFIPIVDIHVDLNYFSREKAYYLSNPLGLSKNATRDRIISHIEHITFGEGLCVSNKSQPCAYFKISMPMEDRYFGTVRRVNYITGMNKARIEALSTIANMETKNI